MWPNKTLFTLDIEIGEWFVLVILREQKEGIADLFTAYVKKTAPLKIPQCLMAS